jgi:2-polyprenyl-3-methyl-5-hydroxy-6-metoxy-1,4-benzoquinol methylase
VAEPSEQPPRNPRWGSSGRTLKAEAIWMTLLHQAGPAISHGRWVDIGCGNGGIAAHLAPRVREMVGIDPEPWTTWTEWMCKHPNLIFIQGSYDSEPALISPESVDVVICNQVYEHVPDPIALIRFIHQMLKPGGFCYFAGPNWLFPIEPHIFWPFVHWLPRKFAIQLMRMLGSKRADDLDAFSTHFWQLNSWLSTHFTISNAVPFMIREVIPMQYDSLIWKVLAFLPKRLLDVLNPLSPGFVFVLKKAV